MYSTLEQINARKVELNNALHSKEAEISSKWNELFHPVEDSRLMESPTRRIMSYAQKSVGLIDGAILGWKLYRKFSGKKRRK